MVKRLEIDETLADLVHPATGWGVATRITKSEALKFLERTATDAAGRGERDESP